MVLTWYYDEYMTTASGTQEVPEHRAFDGQALVGLSYAEDPYLE